MCISDCHDRLLHNGGMEDSPLIRTDAAGEPLRLLAVHAHPDDESSKGAATMARYVSEGARVMVATFTGGERGDILNPRADTPEARADLTAVRRSEMAEAARILGVEHVWLGFVDSGLPEGDPPPPLPDGCFALQPVEDAARPLVALIREFRPHVVTTYDENGGYPHPDHNDPQGHDGCVEKSPTTAGRNRIPEGVQGLLPHDVPQERARALDGRCTSTASSPRTERLLNWPDDPARLRG